MADREKTGGKEAPKSPTTPASDTNTETTRSPGVPAPQKGGPEKPADSSPSKS